MADFGKLNFAVSFNPQTAFPLDARYYFSSLADAETAAAAAVEVGSSNGTYFFGESVCVVTADEATLYVIQPDGTLKAAGSAILGDDKSIEIVDGAVSLKGFGSATAGQQPRINTTGDGIEWYTPDTSTVSGLSETVAGHTSDIANLQSDKADKATTLEGYGITDAMTATAIAEAIRAAIAETGHASFEISETVPDVATAQDNVLYLVMNSTTGFYDIYAKVGESVVRLDDVSVSLDAYSTTEEMNAAIAAAVAGKVDAVEGKGLSTNDFTDADAAKLAALNENAEENFIKGVDTSEFSVSTEGLLAVVAIPLEKVTGLSDALAGKVDAVDGKGLSSNDFTDEYVTKLDGIEGGAQVNILESISLDGTALPVTEKAIVIPMVSTTAAGAMSATDKVKLDSLDVSAITSMQSDIDDLKSSVVWGEI